MIEKEKKRSRSKSPFGKLFSRKKDEVEGTPEPGQAGEDVGPVKKKGNVVELWWDHLIDLCGCSDCLRRLAAYISSELFPPADLLLSQFQQIGYFIDVTEFKKSDKNTKGHLEKSVFSCTSIWESSTLSMSFFLNCNSYIIPEVFVGGVINMLWESSLLWRCLVPAANFPCIQDKQWYLRIWVVELMTVSRANQHLPAELSDMNFNVWCG